MLETLATESGIVGDKRLGEISKMIDRNPVAMHIADRRPHSQGHTYMYQAFNPQFGEKKETSC